MVSLHGGVVSAHSDGEEKGSEFTVRLPLAPAADAEPTVRTPPAGTTAASIDRTPLRVLIVDDNEDAAHMLAELLRSAGHETRTAYHALAALNVADEFAPDAALVDIGLPVMDGYELAERLRAEAPRLRLIAVTGYGQSTDRQRSREAGFDEHLVKPIDFDVLEHALDRFAWELRHDPDSKTV
jgi:CheY-like chemotaxis protein